jgi:hypothetical protein
VNDDDDAWGIHSPTPGYDPIAPVNVNGGRKRGVSKRAVAVISVVLCVSAAGFLAGTVSQSHGNGAQETKSPIASPSVSPSATPSISASNLTSAIPAWAVPVASSDSYDAWNQKAFIGVVAGYGNPDSPSDKTNIEWIQVDWVYRYTNYDGEQESDESEAIKFAMVMPYDPKTCGAVDRYAHARAFKELKLRLPIGKEVLVIRTDLSAHDAFFHQIDATTQQPNPIPPIESINEDLVSTGTWVPDSDTQSIDRPYDVTDVFISGPDFASPKPVVKYDLQSNWYSDKDYEEAYYGRIMRAANRALKYSATGVDCQNSYRKYVRVAVAAAIKEQRRQDAEIKKLEQETTYVYCRDGDGDGICFED